MTTERQFAETFHPGVFLEDELVELGWSQTDLAEVLGRPAKLVSEIILGKRAITPETAIGLSRALGISAQTWLNLESAYQLSKTEQEQSDVELKAKLYAKFPVREMIKRGWIQATDDLELLKQRFLDFFEIPTLDDEPDFNCAARKSTSYTEKTHTLPECVAVSGKNVGKGLSVKGKFSLTKLTECKQQLRLLLHEAVEIRHIPRLLAQAGIRFVILEAMPKAKIDGATFWLGDEPVIVMSLRFDRIDNFWFTLMHELSHVENGEGKDAAIIDVDLLGESEEEKPEFEKRADADAAEFCVPQSLLSDFIIRMNGYFLESKILGFALVNKVHPGIVVGQLQNKGQIQYSHHRKFLEKVRGLITEPAFTDGFGYAPSV